MLKRGNVDVVISHAPGPEGERLRGHRNGLTRRSCSTTSGSLGPLDDPAGVKQATTGQRAMRRIAASGVRFISRGDSSGTHQRERELWSRAAITPSQGQVVAAGSPFPGFFLYYPTRKQQPTALAAVIEIRRWTRAHGCVHIQERWRCRSDSDHQRAAPEPP